jgi:hypothetical protein
MTDFIRMGLIVICVRQMVLGLVHPGQVSPDATGLAGPGLIGVLARPTAADLVGPGLIGVLARHTAAGLVGPGLVGVLDRPVAGLVNPRLVGVLSVNNIVHVLLKINFVFSLFSFPYRMPSKKALGHVFAFSPIFAAPK